MSVWINFILSLPVINMHFYKMCKVLPHIINDIIKEDNQIKEQNDTVIDDLKTQWNSVYSDLDYELAMTLSMYMLGFSQLLRIRSPNKFYQKIILISNLFLRSSKVVNLKLHSLCLGY